MMIKKIPSALFKFLSITLLGLVLLLSFSFAVMQTKWFKNKLSGYLIENAKEQGYVLTMGNLQGIPPFKWSIDKVHLQINETNSLLLENVKLRIAFFPLMNKQLSISYLNVENATYVFAGPSFSFQGAVSLPPLPAQGLPFSFSARTLKVRKLVLCNTTNDEEVALSLHGSAKIKENLSTMLLELKVSSPDLSDVYAQVYMEGGEKKDYLTLNLDLHVPSTQVFDPFFTLPLDASIILKSSCKGPWSSWKALATGIEAEQKPLHVALTGTLTHLSVPSYPLLDRDWKVTSAFYVFPSKEMRFEKFTLESDLLELTSKFRLSSDFDLSRLAIAFSIFDLSAFNAYLPIPMQGSLNGKAKFNDQIASLDVTSTSSLKMADQDYQSFALHLDTEKKLSDWMGSASWTLSSPELFWSGGVKFDLKPSSIELEDVFVKAANAQIDGCLHYNFSSRSVEGSFFVQAPDLRPFRILYPESHLDGSFGGEIFFCSQDLQTWGLKMHLQGKNLRYFDKLVGSVVVEADVKNLLDHPQGQFAIDSENVLFSDVFFSKMALISLQNESAHPFEVHISGAQPEEMALDATGTWLKEESLWSVHFDTLSGSMHKKSLQLDHPFTISGEKDRLDIQDFLVKASDGTFYLNVSLNEDSAEIETKAEHFPLDIFTLAKPSFSLHGTTSFDGFLKADKTAATGQLNLVLEQADFLQFGRTEPLQAKGSLQAHISDHRVQIHSHLYATGAQFLDGTGTLPIDYQLYPFRMKIDKENPLSCEVTLEGALEEIFDFINIGSHKAQGLVTAHLFLSQTLDEPSLQGQIELQAGTYENYFTGTVLKNIEARLESSTKELRLVSFTAVDNAKGTLEAEGALELNPSEKFPYTLTVELGELNLLHYEMIDGQFTGPLYIKGNMEGAYAQGNLLVPKADINIFEGLPFEVPILPITYINRPIHLDASSLIPTRTYPLHFDVELTAKDNVFVKGKGLNAELKGNLQLTGTNTVMAANGTLTLIKGDYIFSGKKFTLTQGEISFNDKPTPSAYLKLTGSLQLADISVLATLQGPLTSPTLTFQSIPHLPTSSILARILFNRDISEITPLQAIQLANVIVSMSGNGGPDVLEAIRKSIGIDRLNIVGKDGTDEISVEIGWYLAHGVTVTLSQSATSSDVTIEVDLKHGFIFQAETQNQEEGKFSLKWNKNY